MARKPIKYEFQADADDFQRGARDAEKALKGIERAAERTENALDLKPDVDDSAINTLRRRLLEMRTALENDIRINPEIDATEALMDLRRIERQLKQLDRMDVRPEVHIDRDGNLSSFTTKVLPELTSMLPQVATSLARVGTSSPYAAAGLAALAAAAAGATAAIGTGLGGGLVAALVGKGAYSLLGAYDQIEVANRRFDTVFGDQADTVTAWARDLGYSIGAGTEAVKGQAAAVQDLLIPRGFSRAKASKVTTAVLDRAAALAEWAGVDIQTASDAVIGALLGEREQLKGLGIDISQVEVNRRKATLKAKDEYKGLNDGQLEVLATQQLIEEKSVDAWTAWTEGASDAGDALDNLNATIANLKTDAIAGFGGIFAEIVSDLVGGAGDLQNIDLAGWIEENRARIREVMLDIAEFTLVGAEAFVDLGIAGLKSFQAMWPSIKATTMLLAEQAVQAQMVAGGFLLMSPATRVLGIQLLRNAGNTRDLAEAAIGAGDAFMGFSDDAIAGLETIKDGIGTVLTDVRGLKELDAIKVQLGVTLKEDGKKAVRAQMKALTDDQIATIIAQADRPSATKTDKELGAIAEKERKARIKVEQSGAKSVEQAIKDAARDRTATISVQRKWITNPGASGYPLPAGRTFYSVPTQAQFTRAAVGSTAAATYQQTAYAPGTVILQGVVIDPDGAARALEKVLDDHYARVGR